MKVLVTGGTGFTGKALVKRLVDDGHEVVSLDYKEHLKTDEIRNWGVKVIIGSVTDKNAVEEAIEGVDVVQHLAAAFREMDVPESYYDKVNVGGTINMLDAAVEHNVKKFIYCSTCGVHGNIDNPPANEDAPIQPADYYQKTKYKAEPIVNEYYKEKGLKTTIVRPTAIYGPGDPERFFMIYKNVAKGHFPMFGGGKTFYHPVYIDNLVDGFILAMEKENSVGRTYLIADEKYVEIEELVKEVGRSMNIDVKIEHFPIAPLIAAGKLFETIYKPFHKVPPIFPRRVDWFRQNRAFNISRAKEELGYKPKVGLKEGLRRTAEWYKQEGYLK